MRFHNVQPTTIPERVALAYWDDFDREGFMLDGRYHRFLMKHGSAEKAVDFVVGLPPVPDDTTSPYAVEYQRAQEMGTHDYLAYCIEQYRQSHAKATG